MATFTLQSNDNQTFTVDYAVVRQSKMFTEMFKHIGIDATQGLEEPIPLPNLNGAILKKVVEFCEYHKNDPILGNPDEVEPHAFKLSDWQTEFMKVDDDKLYDLIMAANYLEIPLLLETGSKKLAEKLKGKTPNELRKMMGIEEEYDPKIEEEVIKELGWDKDIE
ncbi:unnamed protein product [Bursaphelenchus okinawaensis]|uniref:Skp1-related protein n=1 Tax=Bursaphelenchus okinawaensis TaxID=465554 RepID=A0A811K0W6_9BILA|nr:unnamed protein product [Bursaphelenchus okinawaensis]CAG9088549.1 unnamed protein product [Bursaphelenchus okinawaensis]